jgi:4-amino-4-deoxy-L-arabinose transferase-like glycosyltransferase
LAALLFTTLPPVLAHAGLVTTDMALAAMVAAAAYLSLLWAEAPSRRRALALGVAMGLAALAKWSALVFLPAAWMLMFGWSAVRAGWSPRRAARAVWERRRSIAAALAVAFLVVWAGYRFTFARVAWLHFPMPAPRFFSGIYRLWMENRNGHPAYLLGQRSATGFWVYYPVALGVKTPLAMLLLLAAAPWLVRGKRALLAMPLAFSLGVLLFAMTSRINVGVRHVLPMYAGFSVACGIAAAVVFRTPGRKALKCAVGALLAWHAVSGALQHPDYLAYGNEIAGNHLEAFVDDSDLDWGQDMKRLGDFLRTAGAAEVAFSPFNRTYEWAGHPFPRIVPVNPGHPLPGWNAVSVTMWKTFGDPAWPDHMQPQWRIGRSILLWRLPATQPVGER